MARNGDRKDKKCASGIAFNEGKEDKMTKDVSRAVK